MSEGVFFAGAVIGILLVAAPVSCVSSMDAENSAICFAQERSVEKFEECIRDYKPGLWRRIVIERDVNERRRAERAEEADQIP